VIEAELFEHLKKDIYPDLVKSEGRTRVDNTLDASYIRV